MCSRPSPRSESTPTQGAVDYRRRVHATRRNRRATYEVKLATIMGQID